MPLPLVPLASALAVPLMGLLKWASFAAIVNWLTDNGVVREVERWIVSAALERSGLRLAEEDPLSDASLSAAVSEKFGVPIRSLKDQQMIEEDLDYWTAGKISERSGYLVRSVSNVDILKEDLERVAAAVLSDRLNIPAGVIAADYGVFDPVAIKERLLAWAKAELMTSIEAEIGVSLEEIMAIPDIESAAGEINGRLALLKSDQFVTARRLALNVANTLAMNAVTEYQQVAMRMTKRQRRQEQLRQAQAKFRRRHGNRQVYVPLGFSAAVTENPPPAGG